MQREEISKLSALPSSVAGQTVKLKGGNKMKKTVVFLIMLLLCVPKISYSNDWAKQRLSDILMRNTFMIEGPSAITKGRLERGTVFIILRPSIIMPDMNELILVTAAHVLKNISGDFAKIYFRKAGGKKGYEKCPDKFQIRKSNILLYVTHPEVDIAVMPGKIPVDVKNQCMPIPDSLLATDSIFETFEISSGDELYCLGFPLGLMANDMAFPILRSGKIASYPLTPVKQIKTFFYDFEVFGGNSGGPVFFFDYNRYYGGRIHWNERINFIAGIVSEQQVNIDKIKLETKSRKKYRVEYEETIERLSLAKVIHAHYIKETIELLDPKVFTFE